MANVAIKGHATRGKEVIQILEMLGGDNSCLYATGNIEDLIYFISENKSIIEYSRTFEKGLPQFLIFTLEEFLEKFPYKVGDKVIIPEYESEVRICKMHWDGYEVQYNVFCDESEWYSAEELNSYNSQYKEETMDKVSKAVFYVNAQCCDIMNHLTKGETMKDNSILNQLIEYFNNTPRDIIEKEWHEYDKYNEIAPTVKEFLESVGKPCVIMKDGYTE